MKITDVTLTLFTWDGLPAIQYSSHNPETSRTSQLGLVTVQTDQGLEGHAFLGSAMRSAELDAVSLIQVLKPMVIGEDPLDRERLYSRLWLRHRLTTLRCIGAIDVALWDLAGQAAGLPLYKLLGASRRSIPAYASSPGLDSADAYVAQALAVKAQGLTAYKIHPPARWEEDIRVCRAVRKAMGDDYRLMLDSTWAYRYDQALRVGRAIEELNYYWYEDPLAEDDIYNCVKLRQKLAIPLMATEYAPGGFHSYAIWVTSGATDYLRGDVATKGGITACLKAAHLAEAFQMNFEVHHGGNSLNNVANLHLALAIPNTEYFEVLLPDQAQKYGLAEELEVDSHGLVHAIDRPGLGARIDFDLIQRKRTAVLS
jgi:L-alanine-DL-glutamate epimerase-like enolase superfamily enzyme